MNDKAALYLQIALRGVGEEIDLKACMERVAEISTFPNRSDRVKVLVMAFDLGPARADSLLKQIEFAL